MTNIGLMAYYLGIEVKQMENGIFISQEGYAKEILKKFKMIDCKPINTPVECGVKLTKHEDGENVDATLFKSLVRSLRYLTCIRLDILFGVGLVSRFMEAPTMTHFKATKRILCYVKGTIDFGLSYSSSNEYKLVSYCDSDWARNLDDKKNTTGFVLFLGNTALTWSSKKQLIVALSTCETEYVAVTSCNLAKEFDEGFAICTRGSLVCNFSITGYGGVNMGAYGVAMGDGELWEVGNGGEFAMVEVEGKCDECDYGFVK
ncbi:uncharacterized protein LOC114309257 [Camellia sinensis]|uniref:uncharacterized protein LOC114309257 n=1 Tax=Camellia sinensis TaxID=4442 RepID=UPI001036BAF1|nr:uncharacterized protein LOC114309257 [Camellia sinensis]